ncbi:MAG TPA: hypothetical protein VGI70_00235, partial [Polyangiales bacterium]
ASLLARFVVTIGVLSGAVFLWMHGNISDLTLTDIAWQSWLPRAIGLTFGILLMLALLVFMDARSTGGSAVWASFVLSWYAFYAAAEILRAAWPKDADGPDLARIPVDTLLAWTSAPILTALLSLGLAQLMAAGLADVSTRRAETVSFGPRSSEEFGQAGSARRPT